MIIHVSDVVIGSMADIRLTDISNVLQQLNPKQLAIGDSGYQGKENIRVPVKRNSNKRKQQKLQPNITRLQIEHGKELQRQRSVIENINERLKLGATVGTIYRGQREDLSDVTIITRVVCVLCNVHRSRYPIRKESE
jgi:hypothetical protein